LSPKSSLGRAYRIFIFGLSLTLLTFIFEQARPYL